MRRFTDADATQTTAEADALLNIKSSVMVNK